MRSKVRVGSPRCPQLEMMADLEYEHCTSADSRGTFSCAELGISTTPEIEWHFVVEPQGGLQKLGLPAWPQPAAAPLLHRSAETPGQQSAQQGRGGRTARPLSDLEAPWQQVPRAHAVGTPLEDPHAHAHAPPSCPLLCIRSTSVSTRSTVSPFAARSSWLAGCTLARYVQSTTRLCVGLA